MWATEESAQIVRWVIAGPFVLMGVSHLVQPTMWRDFFVYLHGLGQAGVVVRTFALELVPAVVIVNFHQDWSGWGLPITIYGWALTAKIVVSLLLPNVGLRSLAMADRHGARGFVPAGVMLIILGVLAGLLATGVI